MKYSVYIKQGNLPEEFLQSSDDLAKVKKDKASIERWLAEMSVAVIDHSGTVFTIYENGAPILTKRYLGEGSRVWAKAVETS
jgi:hypothetical protein